MKNNNKGKNLQLTREKSKYGTYPTRMPSSISVGETLSPSPTTNCKFQMR